jgi:pimeloyl-ACP methyl ester carboxylesterase
MAFWRAWVPLLGGDYRVLRMDPRGYGDTSRPRPGSTITPELLAADAIGLMDALGIERVHWVGEATGGTIGLVAALNHPRRIASITLVNGFARMNEQNPTLYAIGEASQEAAILKYGLEEWCRRTLHYRMDLSRAPAGLADWMAKEMARTPAYMAIAAFKFFSGVDLTPRLPGVAAPVLIVNGSGVSERLKQHVAEMRGKLPRAKAVEIPGYDYGIHLLAPDAVVAQVRGFLRDAR